MITFEDTAENITQDDLTAFESKYGFSLPDEYKNHILQTNGGMPSHDIFIDKNGKEYSVASFYSIKNGDNTIDALLDIDAMGTEPIMDSHMFPFADDPYGNNYCINTIDGTISIWYHDMDGETIQLAQSFSDFLAGLTDTSSEYLV